ncbi:MAG: choice-of-anchor D domain-containing protein [Acidobacteriota bacterium]|nr:choice-of-anchor D domain-containing protein [Acidobacteriota bacterium]
MLFVLTAVAVHAAQGQAALASRPATQLHSLPPRVAQAQRFLAQRGWGMRGTSAAQMRVGAALIRPRAETASTANWQALGPAAVTSANFGLVTGRVSSIALDPADSTGNRIYVGTTGGGVWLSQNAGTSNASSVAFTPLTDTPSALSGAIDDSISIGAITVQPGGTGVILAGTGDPNDALDSYYGAGILRSTDSGNTWSVIQTTKDVETGLGFQDFAFAGEGFAGFAWSTVSPQVVVAAVSQAYEGTLVDAERSGVSYEGLYYSSDSGATWHLATITDGSGSDVQGPTDAVALPDGNAATAVVWNPVRRLFVAAVRYHGYYQSSDGVTWTRMTAQPGTGLTAQMCPTNLGSTGSVACPIFRGALGVNPVTGDTFAWTVDRDNQDQGIWQDACAISGGACTNATITFAKEWTSTALETGTALGSVTIANGDYNLALAAVPSGQDTLLLAGANDVWKCSLAAGCAWRNTTNAMTCMSAQVAGYQHALAWNTANPLEIFVGNDSGLWRSTDAIGETGTACNATDATHFQNLNGGLGSLAEVESMSQITTSPYTMMTGLGVNGTAGVKSTTGPTTVWPEILGGEGGPVAIDPTNSSNWYVNNQAGVSVHLCSQTGNCTASAFGASPVVSDADVSGDGNTMTLPAPFLVDPLDSSQLLVGTCRVWRGPASGSWSGANAISPFLDGATGNSYCSGDALIRTMAALATTGGEVAYAGMYGAADGGATKAGHVFSATFNPSTGAWSAWTDLTLNPVSNDSLGMNVYGLDISSIYVDPHDATGNTVYVTVEGMPNPSQAIRVVYRSTDGGAHWSVITSNLPAAPASSIVIDPLDANTAYIATDVGVYSTRQVGNCASAASNCWSAYGVGLPEAPVVGLSAAPASSQQSVLAAATYGRGVWQIPLWTAGTQLTTATVSPTTLTFTSQALGTTSSAQAVTLTNTGSVALTPTSIALSGDFSETDNCVNATLNAGASCTVQVTFTPSQTGTRTGQLAIHANVSGGQLTVGLTGTGVSSGAVQLSPVSISFGTVEVGTTSSALHVTVQNSGATAISITSINATAPFALASNACGTSIAANSACQLTVDFAPTQTGAATGTLTVVDDAGTQTVALSGTGAAPPTDTLSPTSLTFSGTIIGQLSSAQTVTLTNSGGEVLTSIALSTSGPFQVSSNCGTQLAASSSCAISVVYAPTAAGAQTGTLTVSDALRTQTVALTGTGLLPPVLGVSPTSLGFPSQQVGTSSSPLTLTVNNTGGAPMANVGFQITGFSAGSFATGSTTCGATLNNGSSCTVQVIFAPVAAGGNTATLTVTSSTLGVKPVPIALNGTGTTISGINVSPAQLSFVEPTIGQTSAAQTVMISNSGTVSASGLTLVTTAPFSLTQNACGTSLAAGASCSVGVVFTPVANGTVTGTLTVGSSTYNPATALLSGAGGLAGAVLVQPAQLTFPTTGVGATSSAQIVAVTNTSTSVTLTDLVLSASCGYQLSGNTCPASLSPGASCTTGVVFAPTSAGQQTGSLTVASSALAASTQASLSGMGFDFTATLSGQSSQTVASGQTASYTIDLSPLNGSTGTFTFACGSLPANAACIFSPSSDTVAAGTSGSVTVQVATGQAQVARLSRGESGWGMVPALCGLVLLPWAWRRRRSGLLLVLAALLVTGGLSSCSASGGGGGTPPPGSSGSNTAAGTYSIPVTISANGISHKVTLSLTVD